MHIHPLPQVIRLRKKLNGATSVVRGLFGAGESQVRARAEMGGGASGAARQRGSGAACLDVGESVAARQLGSGA